MKECSVVIPCHNEKDSILRLLQEIHKALPDKSYSAEIIVVDDFSSDGSRGLIKKCGLPITLIENQCRMGYGASLKRGIRKARCEHIVIIDADGTYPAEMVPELLDYAIGYGDDMVVGARIKKNNKTPFGRRPAKWFLNIFAEYISGRSIPDLNSGLRVMKKSLLEIYFNILPNGFSFTTTITLAMLTDNRSVHYVPIDYYQRQGSSKIRPISDTFNFILLITKTALYFNPLKIFVPMAIIFILAASLVFLYSYLSLGKIMDATVTILVVSAIQMLFLGMITDLINRRSR